jgi:hypothetical protein
MGVGSVVDPFVVAPTLGVLGDDSSESEGEDIGGGGGALSPSYAEVDSASCRCTMDVSMLEESEDDAEAHSLASFWSVAFRATVQRTDAGTSGAVLDSPHLGEDLLSVFALFTCFLV